MDYLDTAGTRRWVDGFASAVRDCRNDLNELDRLIGDGDFGTNVDLGMTRATTVLADKPPAGPGEVFAAVAISFFGAAGTSGPLLGSWFQEFAQNCADGVTAETFTDAVTGGLVAVQELGGAEPGHKTMVDAMAPAAHAVRAAGSASLRDLMTLAADHAAEGAELTRQLSARRGRARYVGTNSRGILDPGALTVALFFDVGACTLHGDTTTTRTPRLLGLPAG